jgi:hypothetical protein
MWAVVHCLSLGDVMKLDIDLCDDSGAVCVRFKEVSLRAMAASQHVTRTSLRQPVWHEEVAVTGTVTYARHIVFLCGIDADVEREIPNSVCFRIDVGSDFDGNFEVAAASVLESLQELTRASEMVLVQVVVPAQGIAQAFSGWKIRASEVR